jgi:hypothetical protein
MSAGAWPSLIKKPSRALERFAERNRATNIGVEVVDSEACTPFLAWLRRWQPSWWKGQLSPSPANADSSDLVAKRRLGERSKAANENWTTTFTLQKASKVTNCLIMRGGAFEIPDIDPEDIGVVFGIGAGDRGDRALGKIPGIDG